MLARTLRAMEQMLRKKPRPPTQVQHVLFLEYRLPLGCCVHLSPAFEAIKRSRPDVQITVATRGLGAQVHRHSPFLDHLIETPDPLTDLYAAAVSLRTQLRSRNLHPDCVLTGASDSRTRISLLAILATTGWRGGYTQKAALYQHPLTYDPTLSLIGNNLRLAHLLGCNVSVTQPRVFFSQADVAAATALAQAANPTGKPLVVFVTQNSGGQNTGWHTERFVQTLQAVYARGCAILFVGTAADTPAIEALSAAAGNLGTSAAGRTSVPELAALLALSDFAITLDTGTMHVGRAAGVPMVVLGPSWQKPLEWLPLEVENVRILRGKDRPDVPPDYHLDEITAEAVIAAFDDLFRTYTPSHAARESRLHQGLSAADHLA